MHKPTSRYFFALTLGVVLAGLSGCIESNGVPGEKIKVVNLPMPKEPSQVLGIGEAMEAGQDILLFRLLHKSSAVSPDVRRNFYFIGKIMESYASQAKVIELGSSVSWFRGDYYEKIREEFPLSGYGVIRKENGGYKAYTSKFVFSESYDDSVVTVKNNLEKILGPGSFDINGLIARESKFPAYNRAMSEGRNLIIYSFAGACSSFPPAEQKEVKTKILANFSAEAEILELDPNAYTDPSTALYSKCRNIVCVYNSRTKKISPALFVGSDEIANIRKFLDEE